MSTKEEEERFIRLNSENEELKLKIAEKERQIDEVKKKIEHLTKEQMDRKRQEEKEKAGSTPQVQQQQKGILKKAVRIQEPNETSVELALKPLPMSELGDSTSDSGFASTKVSKPSDTEFSESYL